MTINGVKMEEDEMKFNVLSLAEEAEQKRDGLILMKYDGRKREKLKIMVISNQKPADMAKWSLGNSHPINPLCFILEYIKSVTIASGTCDVRKMMKT